MATATQKLLTAEEFAELPDPTDGSRQELVRGEVVTMPPPKSLHGYCCSKIDRRLGNFVEERKLGNVFCNDTGFITERDPDSVRGPDVAYWSHERLPEVKDEYSEVPPDLAIEVLSSHKDLRKTRDKLKEYFERGVRMAWVIDPINQTVTVYRSADEGRILHDDVMLSGEEVVPGFSCAIRELFP